MDVSRLFLENFTVEEVSRMFQGCFMIFKGVSREFHESFKNNLSRCFMKVSYCMALIAASRAEGGLVSKLLRIFSLKLLTYTDHNLHKGPILWEWK